MKTLSKSLLFVAVATFGIPAFAAPENHEAFAREYVPESQAVFERFRKECAEAKKLRESLAEDLRVMNQALEDDAGYCALSEKIAELEKRESEWANTVKDAFFKHKAGMVTSDNLSEADAVLAKKSIAWENDILEKLVKNSIARFGVPVTVKIPGRNYAFGKYEVTQKQYEEVMGNNPSAFKGRNLPVEHVLWNDAVEFCKKLTERERLLGRISQKQKYRLPSSEEWEHACRAGTMTRYYTGNTGKDLARAGWYRGNSGSGGTQPVGLKEANVFGLYDMHGNVWEWTLTPDGSNRVYRGGSWDDLADNCESSYWDSSSPEYRYKYLGFRVVLSEVQ